LTAPAAFAAQPWDWLVAGKPGAAHSQALAQTLCFRPSINPPPAWVPRRTARRIAAGRVVPTYALVRPRFPAETETGDFRHNPGTCAIKAGVRCRLRRSAHRTAFLDQGH